MSRWGARVAAIAAVICALGAADAQAGSIAFVSTRCEAGEQPRFVSRPGLCQERVWRVDDDGSGLRRLTETSAREAGASEPVWSPDGRRIAYAFGGGYVNVPAFAQIWLMNADGSNPHPLTPGGDLPPARYSPGGNYSEQTPTWSPDGRMLVFAVGESGLAADLFVVAADGSGYRRLTNTSQFESDPSFSPDGLSILFTRRDLGPLTGEPPEGDGLYSLSLVDGRTRRLTLGPSYEFAARYSPDGRRISYLDDSAVWTMTADGQDKTRRTASSPVYGPLAAKPVWSGPNALIFGGPGADLRSFLQQLDVSRPGMAPAPKPLAIGAPDPPAADQQPSWHPGTPVVPLPPLPDTTPPELGLTDVAPPGPARAAARRAAPRTVSRGSLRYTVFDRSGIGRLQASVERRRGKRCRYLTRKGMTKRVRSCRRPVYFRVGKRDDWTRRLALLRPGTYRIRLRGWDARGNHVKHPRPKTVRIRR